MKKFFSIGETLPKKTILLIEIFGLVLFLAVWYVLTIPKAEISLGFVSTNPSDTKYVWQTPEKSKKEFLGDNVILKAKPGTYLFTATDTTGCIITDSIVIPAKLTEKILKESKKVCGADTFKIYLEIKSVEDGFISKAIIPPPLSVLKSFKELHFKDFVVRETLYSLELNILGYFEAIFISIIIGFTIALIPFFRALLSRWVNAIRFVPLTAVTGLFIAWFGIASNMKVQFLTFGIFVYLLPVVVQRIDEVQKILLQTAFTLGASKWQMIKSVYFPSVSSKIIDDIRVLTAISWTYIIIAEMLNQTGGIGALIHLSGRQSRLDKVFALLIIIILIGIIQDRLFAWADKILFKYKYQATTEKE
jgi:ABC-type nitrate/sulfonate/bicarbonate transport system permease component